MSDPIKIFESSLLVIIFIISFILLQTTTSDEDKKNLLDDNTLTGKLKKLYPLFGTLYFYIIYLIYRLSFVCDEEEMTDEFIKNSKKKYFIFIITIFLSLISYFTIYRSTIMGLFIQTITCVSLFTFIYFHCKTVGYYRLYLFIYPVFINLMFFIINLDILNN